MEHLPYSERDLARIFLSLQLKELAELSRQWVARPSHEGDSTTMLRELLPPLANAVSHVRKAAVAYARARGASWTEVAEATGATAEMAEREWGAVDDASLEVGEPVGAADLLDRWYIHHVGLADPLGAVRDAFSRMLDGSAAPNPSRCLVCRKYEHGAVPAWAGSPNPPGGHLYEDAHWRVGHGPPSFWPAGTLLVESRRHFLDYSDFTPQESTMFGSLLGRLFAAVKTATTAKRVHVFSSMDGAPHFHVWLIPRVSDEVIGKQFLGSMGNCTRAEAEQTMRAIRAAFQQSDTPRAALQGA